MPGLRRGAVSGRPKNARTLILGVFLAVAACSPDADAPTDGDAGEVPLVTPSNPYEEFTYSNEVQRRAFLAYLDCAEEHGVTLRGPYTDSRGEGVMFQLADADTPPADPLDIDSACPQMMVGIFATPIDGGSTESLFERSAARFARCLRSAGFPRYPLPEFGNGDPYASLDQLPFHWRNQRFVRSVAMCIEPLEAYVFSSVAD